MGRCPHCGAGGDQACRPSCDGGYVEPVEVEEGGAPSPSIYHSEVNKDRTAREDRPCAE